MNDKTTLKPIKVVILLLFLSALIFFFIYNFSFIQYQEIKNFSESEKAMMKEIQNNNFTKESDAIVLIAVGDIMLSRVVAEKMLKHGYDYPFLKVKEYLRHADIVFGNLETAITAKTDPESDPMRFQSDPRVAKELQKAHFNILSLANNHTPDYGQQGLQDTFDFLRERNISFVGAGNTEAEAYAPIFLEIKGKKFAFLAYNEGSAVSLSYAAGEKQAGTAFMDLEKMREVIKDIREQADFIVVSMHAGDEYESEPTAFQIHFARSAVDAGADLVIGHHPHVVQKAELYKGKYIFYSLGNFIFDQMWSQETGEGMVVKFYISDNIISRYELKPIIIEDYCQPNFAESLRAEEINAKLRL